VLKRARRRMAGGGVRVFWVARWDRGAVVQELRATQRLPGDRAALLLVERSSQWGSEAVLVRTSHCASARGYLCDREGWAVMPLCILCDSETTELLGATICKRCDTQYGLSEAAADELKQAVEL